MPTRPKAPERETIYIPRPETSRDDQDVFVAVNGVNYVIPKGESSQVPYAVAEELRRSERAKRKQFRNIDNMRAAAK